MAKKRPIPSKSAGQEALPLGPIAEKAPVGKPVPWLKPGGRSARYMELTFENFQNLADGSETDVQDPRKENDYIENIANYIKEFNFDSNGDALILDGRLRLIDGDLRVKAAMMAGQAIRVLVIWNIDTEARFSTGDSLKVGKPSVPSMPRPGERPPIAGTVDLATMPADVRAVVGKAFVLRGMVAETLGHAILEHWTPELIAESARAVADLPIRGLPRELAVFAHACIVDIAPVQAKGFLAILADPSIAPRSAPALLAAGLPGHGRYVEPLAFLRTCALAIESYVQGDLDDPHVLVRTTKRVGARILHVLVGANGSPAGRLTTCHEETFSLPEIEAVLAAGGRPIESWSARERERIEPLRRDVRRGRGLQVTGETFKFTSDGILIDGFDRMAACYLAGFPASGFVVRGFREGFQHHRYQGPRSSLGHRYYSEGYSSPFDIPSILSLLHCMTEDDRKATATNTYLRYLHETHPQVQHTVVFTHVLKVLVEKRVLGAAHVALSRYSRELADMFVSELHEVWQVVDDTYEERTGNAPPSGYLGSHEADAPKYVTLRALALRLSDTKGIGRYGKPKVKASDEEKLCNVIEAMEAWFHDRPLRRFSGMPAKGFLRLGMPPQVRAMKDLMIQAAKSGASVA